MQKPNLTTPVLDARVFTWKHKYGYACASDFGTKRLWGRVWNDACDVGFWAVNKRTNKKVLFTLVKECKDRDNDVVSWLFHSLGHKDLIEIRLFND